MIYKPGDIVLYRRANSDYTHVLLSEVFDTTAIGQQISTDGYTLEGSVLVVIANIRNRIPTE